MSKVFSSGLLNACPRFFHQEFVTQITTLANSGTCNCTFDEADPEGQKKGKDEKKDEKKLSASATARTIEELHSQAHRLKGEGFTVGTYIDLRKKDDKSTVQAYAITEVTEESVSLKPYELLKDHPIKKVTLEELKLYKIVSLSIPTPVTGWSSPYDNISWSWEGIKAEVLLGWGVVIGPASK